MWVLEKTINIVNMFLGTRVSSQHCMSMRESSNEKCLCVVGRLSTSTLQLEGPATKFKCMWIKDGTSKENIDNGFDKIS